MSDTERQTIIQILLEGLLDSLDSISDQADPLDSSEAFISAKTAFTQLSTLLNNSIKNENNPRMVYQHLNKSGYFNNFTNQQLNKLDKLINNWGNIDLHSIKRKKYYD